MKQKPSRAGRWLAIGAALYGSAATTTIGNMAYIDSQRPAIVRVEPAVQPPEALAPEPLLPPCDASAILKPEGRAPGKQIAVVKPVELNVRAAPGARILGQVRAGDRVEILERRGGWLRIDRGWIAAAFVTEVDDSPAPAAAEQPFPCLVPGPWCPAGVPSLLPPLPPLSQR